MTRDTTFRRFALAGRPRQDAEPEQPLTEAEATYLANVDAYSDFGCELVTLSVASGDDRVMFVRRQFIGRLNPPSLKWEKAAGPFRPLRTFSGHGNAFRSNVAACVLALDDADIDAAAEHFPLNPWRARVEKRSAQGASLVSGHLPDMFGASPHSGLSQLPTHSLPPDASVVAAARTFCGHPHDRPRTQ